MELIVQKFGGSSVANKEKLKLVAEKIIEERDKQNNVVVVVSAQGKTTDKLILEEKEISQNASTREHDVLISTGEQISSAKLTILLQELGYKAISLLGWQIPIITTSEHGNAKIKYINKEIINEKLNEGKIVIIAGFQGINEEGEITTLGRGGSDTTAVALASILEADRCDIYTDVDGVFSSDPRIVDEVRKIDKLHYSEMLEMASSGANVLHNRCVALAQKFNIPINVKSTFEKQNNGSLIIDESIEDLVISGVTKEDYIARITLVGVENKIGKTYKLFKILADENIDIDLIAQIVGEFIEKNISFSVKLSDVEKTLKVLNKNKDIINYSEILYKENLSKISIIGMGMINKPNVAAKMFEALYENNINMNMISTSEIKISVLVESDKATLAMQSIHNKFFK